MGTFPMKNGKDTPLNALQGSVPDVSGALSGFLQQITFTHVTKTVVVGIVKEAPTTTSFWGVWQAAKPTMLEIQQQGERSWNWYRVFTQTQLPLVNDDVVKYLGVQYRVMGIFDQKVYGYMEYHLINDYTGAGPS